MAEDIMKWLGIPLTIQWVLTMIAILRRRLNGGRRQWQRFWFDGLHRCWILQRYCCSFARRTIHVIVMSFSSGRWLIYANRICCWWDRKIFSLFGFFTKWNNKSSKFGSFYSVTQPTSNNTFGSPSKLSPLLSHHETRWTQSLAVGRNNVEKT